MTRHTTAVAYTALVVALAGTAAGGAYAATGGTFVIGKSNYATSTTSLSNSNGTALTLRSKSGTAPLAVNSTTKVSNLNADRLDGLSSSAFRRAGAAVTVATANLIREEQSVSDPTIGRVTCPAGTKVIGVGYALTSDYGVRVAAVNPATNQAYVRLYSNLPAGGGSAGYVYAHCLA